MDYYAQALLEEAATPSNWQEWEVSPENMCHNASCGDSMAVKTTWKDGVLQDVFWHGDGCNLSRAAASVMSRVVQGMSRAEIEKIEIVDVQENLHIQDISLGRVKCVLLFIQCLQREIRTQKLTKNQQAEE